MTSRSGRTDDLRIRAVKELAPPMHLMREFPITARAEQTVEQAREAAHRILHGSDSRCLVVVGPCSIHDADAAIEFGQRLRGLQDELENDLLLVMRVYFEKPRTTIGWKGYINDPYLDGSYQINEGLRLARKLLLDLNELGVPAGTEYLDMITPQYLSDLVSWGAIGARTTESQVHRELASGLSCPVGFKNGSDGNVRVAVDAMKAAAVPHHFLSVTKGGISAIVSTAGNEDCHVILRGGKSPNFDADSVESAATILAKAGLASRIMIDCSHANSGKDATRQPVVLADVAGQLAAGDTRVIGVMLESHLIAGRQDVEAKPLTYGMSVTDACIGWDETATSLRALAKAVRDRRKILAEDA
ncbi:MAG: 3-deoxy-7-phosphoheptulonate synthase [Chthonomonas sp.]|nr:3-deoxy-7-phosphoheptulonate synthase [Chthonomonas sp.]